MIIRCEQCSARFRLADERVGPGGVRVRCARCRHVFRVSPEADVPGPETTREWTPLDAGASSPASEPTREWTPLDAGETSQGDRPEVAATRAWAPLDAGGAEDPAPEAGAPSRGWTGLDLDAGDPVEAEPDPFAGVDLGPAPEADPFGELQEAPAEAPGPAQDAVDLTLDFGGGLRLDDGPGADPFPEQPSRPGLGSGEAPEGAEPFSLDLEPSGGLADDPFASDPPASEDLEADPFALDRAAPSNEGLDDPFALDRPPAVAVGTDEDPFAHLDLEGAATPGLAPDPDPDEDAVVPQAPVDPEAIAAWRAFAQRSSSAATDPSGWIATGRWSQRLQPAVTVLGNVLFAVALVAAVGAGWWVQRRGGDWDLATLREQGAAAVLAHRTPGTGCVVTSLRGRPYPVQGGAQAMVVRGALDCGDGGAWPEALVSVTDREGRPLARGRAVVGGGLDPERVWRAATPEAVAALGATAEAERPGRPDGPVEFFAVFPGLAAERLAGARLAVEVEADR